MKPKVIKMILFAFVLVILAYAVYMAYVDIMKNMPKRVESFEEPKVKICLYKATWCSHCTNYLKSKVFEDTYASIKDKSEYKDVVFATYDYDENKKLAEKYNINSFPSIIAVDSEGNYIDKFSGDRSNKDDIISFVDKSKLKV